jgi:hypothetical protein
MLLLKLFTNLGLLMHFDTPELRNLVVLNTQWLLDVMCELLCLRSMSEKLKRSRNHAPEWRHLRRSGRLDTRLLPEIWPSLSADQCNTMLAYMIKFGLVCPLPTVEDEEQIYVVPALLPVCATDVAVWQPNDDIDQNARFNFIHADGDWDDATGFLPNGLFFTLVAALLSDIDALDVKANLKHLYRDRICISGAQLFMLILRPERHCIELTVRNDTAGDPAIAASLISAHLESGIVERYGVQFLLEVPCSNCGMQTHASRHRCNHCRSKLAVEVWIPTVADVADSNVLQVYNGLSLPEEFRGVKIFISYFSAESQDLFQSLTALLTVIGCVVFQPTKDLINPSQQEMRDAVAGVDLVLAIWSPGYFGSKWCRAEAHEAANKSIPLVPVYNGDLAIQKQIIDGLDRQDQISNAVFSKNIVKVQDVSESSESTTRRIVETISKHSLRPGQPRPSSAPKQIDFTPHPPIVDAVVAPSIDVGLVHAGSKQVCLHAMLLCTIHGHILIGTCVGIATIAAAAR